MLNDLLLLTRIKNGDVQAFENLFRTYYKPLCYYADSFLNDMDSAEEIVQNLFYLFWKEKAELQIRLSVKSYLYKSVQNKVFNYLKHLQVMESYCEKAFQDIPEVRNESPEEHLEYKELESKLASLLQQLPERQRKIFCMNRFGGKKYSEIATELSVSVKTVEADISKVLVLLRKELKHFNQ
ncbi:RNA polymerase sigma-70 factor [Bacteroides sedimenti]|uniref:DNA-directed RNA polymerase sigma-70 factor n=1 Tax=Bacteroides sedimenti TaxID=2136147 RepID=A0ABM8IFE1_9BACE